MKALLALICIYVGTFFLVIQGSPQNPVEAARQASSSAPGAASSQLNSNIDPIKESDIRSLMELVGARDTIDEGANNAMEQAREKLFSTVRTNDKGRAFLNAFATSYRKKFNADQVTAELVGVYDKHFTSDEIKGLLQFYGSPLGQKVASEMPKIARETQATVRASGGKAAREALAEAKQENPGVGQSARLGKGPVRGQQRRAQPSEPETAEQQDPR